MLWCSIYTILLFLMFENGLLMFSYIIGAYLYLLISIVLKEDAIYFNFTTVYFVVHTSINHTYLYPVF